MNESNDWEQKRSEFLNNPQHGVKFFESLYQKIAACVAPGRKTWQDVSSTDKFQQAFEFITGRLLTVDGFRNVVVKHREKKTPLSLFAFMDNRVSSMLAEWNSARWQEPDVSVKADEHIQQKAGSDPPETTQRPQLDFDALMKRIKSLREPRLSAMLLSLWPLPSFPDSWRDDLEPLIVDAGEKNGLSRDEVKRRLEEVMSRSQPVLTHEMVSSEIRLGMHFEKAKLFDRKKRYLFGQLECLKGKGDYSPKSGVEEELKCDCYRAVQEESEQAVLALFAPDDIYKKLSTGRRLLKDRPLWYRRRFSYCCYKQKYHRRVWLQTSLDLLVQKPVEGPMSYSDISWILNCKENTTAANLSRARKALLQPSNSNDKDDFMADASRNEVAEAKIEWIDELKTDRLHAYVCEDLKPEVFGISSKSGS